jgi:salicylate hydroxylase
MTNGSQSRTDVTPVEEYFEADVVVGSDGVKSLTRSALELRSPREAGDRAGGPSCFRYTGTYCYRALIPMEEALKVDPVNSERIGNTLHRPRMAFGPGRHLTIFPIEQHKVSILFVMTSTGAHMAATRIDLERGGFRV